MTPTQRAAAVRLADELQRFDGAERESLRDEAAALLRELLAEPQGEPVGLDAVRQAIEERDDMERKYHDLAEHMVYHGNSVSWWHSKARAYRDAVDKVWSELKAAGIVCDGIKTSADGVRELANPPQQRKPPREQITAAAKALCRQASIACNVDFDDNWKVYGDEYIADATVALNAAYGIGEPT